MDYRAESPSEAVTLARDFQTRGRYAFFRGQARDWPVRPSLFRLADADQVRARERLERFSRWVRSTRGLEEIAANEDWMIAVAQHYGIPTPFLDFTTEVTVAAFFACNGSTPGEDACIVCLEEAAIANEVWALFESDATAELLSFDVPNLWRLQAQQGVFVYCPWDSLDDARRLHRIHFPSGPLATPSGEAIYPRRKSQLEILLDQYFHREEVFKFHEFATEVELERIEWSVPEAGYRAEFFTADGLSPLASWNAEQISNWVTVTTEHWHQAAAFEAAKVRVDPEPSRARDDVRAGILEWLHHHPGARSHLVQWAPVGLDELAYARLEQAMLRTWDGMRLLPYSDDEIAEALAACAALVAAALDPNTEPREAVERCFGPHLLVEFQAGDLSYSRAYVGHAELLGTLREDFFDRVRPEYVADARADGEHLLAQAWKPQLMFEFGPLTRLFAEQVIPSQVVFRPREPVFFSPARLVTFGRR